MHQYDKLHCCGGLFPYLWNCPKSDIICICLVTFRGLRGQQVKGGDPSPLFTTGETHLECWVQVWTSLYKRHMDMLELVQ